MLFASRFVVVVGCYLTIYNRSDLSTFIKNAYWIPRIVKIEQPSKQFNWSMQDPVNPLAFTRGQTVSYAITEMTNLSSEHPFSRYRGTIAY